MERKAWKNVWDDNLTWLSVFFPSVTFSNSKSVLAKGMEIPIHLNVRFLAPGGSAVWAAVAMWEQVLGIKNDNPFLSLKEGDDLLSVQDSY